MIRILSLHSCASIFDELCLRRIFPVINQLFVHSLLVRCFVFCNRAVFWDAPKDLRNAVEDIVVLLEYLKNHHQNIRQGTTSQLLVLCNRTAVHNQLLQHGFQTTWKGGLRVSTSSSAAGATALIAVIVQTGCGFLSGGRRGATLDNREDCFGRATVALTRAIQHTYIVSPVDMAGLIGMAQTLKHSGTSPLCRYILKNMQQTN